MAAHHTHPIDIDNGIDTDAFFSYSTAEVLIIFIHGFGGKSTATWNNFPHYLISEDTFQHCDIYFYGYDTFKGQAGDHAAELYDFIDLASTPLKNGFLPATLNLPERAYKRILLVAHSLGAVLARQVQVLATTAKKDWVHKSELALFAPAHHGAEVVSLAKESLSGIFGLIGIIARYKYPVLTDLDANDEGILKELKETIEKLQDKGEANYTKARLVVYAKNDKVVRNFPYLQDAPPKVVTDASHTSVCKPNDAFMNPFQLLKSIL